MSTVPVQSEDLTATDTPDLSKSAQKANGEALQHASGSVACFAIGGSHRCGFVKEEATGERRVQRARSSLNKYANFR